MKYLVEFTESTTFRYEVEADDPVEAENIAEVLYEDAERQDADELDCETTVFQKSYDSWIELVPVSASLT